MLWQLEALKEWCRRLAWLSWQSYSLCAHTAGASSVLHFQELEDVISGSLRLSLERRMVYRNWCVSVTIQPAYPCWHMHKKKHIICQANDQMICKIVANWQAHTCSIQCLQLHCNSDKSLSSRPQCMSSSQLDPILTAILGWRFAAALLPQLFGTNPRSHHKGATSRVPAGDQQLPVLCHCQLGQTSLLLLPFSETMMSCRLALQLQTCCTALLYPLNLLLVDLIKCHQRLSHCCHFLTICQKRADVVQ